MPPLIEVRSANERGASTIWSPKRRRGSGAVDDRPVDHQLLCPEARPFHEVERDLLMRAGFDGFQHAAVGDGGRVTVTLQHEFRLIDAARDVDREHQQQIDVFRGACRRNLRRDERGESQQAADDPHHGCTFDHIAARCDRAGVDIQLRLEHFQEKWNPVFRPAMRQCKNVGAVFRYRSIKKPGQGRATSHLSLKG